MHKSILALVSAALLAVCSARAELAAFAPEGVAVRTGDASFSMDKIDDIDVLKARLEPSEKWAFVRIVPQSGVWDLSAYTGLEVRITNNGTENVRPGVRVDQDASPKEQAWNTAPIQTLAPGDTKTYLIRFGKDHDKPRPIDTTRIAAIHIFLGKGRTAPSFLTISDIKGVK